MPYNQQNKLQKTAQIRKIDTAKNNFKKIIKNRKKSIDKYGIRAYNKITIKREEKQNLPLKKLNKQQRFQTEGAGHEKSSGYLKQNLPERYSAWSTGKAWKAQKGEMEEKEKTE